MFDVIVLGGGMSGCVAALAAKARGAHVALASRSWGATALSTGAVDIAYTPALSPIHETPRTIAEHIMDIIAHRQRHPYAVLGFERAVLGIRRGFDFLCAALEPAGLVPGPLDLEAENLALPSSLGALLPASCALLPHAGASFTGAAKGRIGVLQLNGCTAFDAKRVAAGVAHDLRKMSGATVEICAVALQYEARGSPAIIARTLDDERAVAILAADVGARARGYDLLLAPPCLGLERHAAVRQRLAEAAATPVIETVAHMPSVPGIRLQRALDEAVTRSGIDRVGEVVAASLGGGKVQGVITSNREELRAGAFVLATGRFVTGGVGWGAHCRETLFGLPVASESGVLEVEGPDAVVRETPMESHPLLTAGVAVGPALQPIAEGVVAYDNLFAAGMAIGGFASRYVLCADGVALSTGFLAGEAAVDRAGAPL